MGKLLSKIFNSDWTKLNKLPSRVAENRSKNSKLECENSRTNLMLNNDEPLIPSRTPERLNEKSRKSLTKPRRTRRTCLESKTWLTNSRSKSRPTNDKPRKPRKLPTPTCPNTENSSTSLMKPKNELIWLNLPSTNSELKPEAIKSFTDLKFSNFKNLCKNFKINFKIKIYQLF